MGVNSSWPLRPRTSSASRDSAPRGSMRRRTAPASLSVTMVLASLVRSTPSNEAPTSATSPAPASASVPSSLTWPSPVMSAGSTNQGVANLRNSESFAAAVEPRTCQPRSSRRPSKDAMVPAIFTPLPANVVTPVSLRNSARNLHVQRAGRAAARRQPSGITTKAWLRDHRLFTHQLETRKLSGRIRQRHFARVEGDACALVGDELQTRAGAGDRRARDGEFAHLENDGVDGMRRRREQQHREAGKCAAPVVRALVSARPFHVSGIVASGPLLP